MMDQSRRRTCELCERTATVYCDSDSAFLCSTCDRQVHMANFLAARHVRRPICRRQHEQDEDHTLVRGMSKEIVPSSPRVVCLSWTESDHSDDDQSSSSSSSCVSRSEPGVVGTHKRLNKTGICRRYKFNFTRKLMARMELVVSDWCRRVLSGSLCRSIRERVEAVASDMVRVGVRKMRNLPLKCVAAASVWMAIQTFSDGNAAVRRRKTSNGGGVLIRRLEECSGVPAKIIFLVETKLSSVLEMRHVEEEGSGECCSS